MPDYKSLYSVRGLAESRLCIQYSCLPIICIWSQRLMKNTQFDVILQWPDYFCNNPIGPSCTNDIGCQWTISASSICLIKTDCTDIHCKDEKNLFNSKV